MISPRILLLLSAAVPSFSLHARKEAARPASHTAAHEGHGTAVCVVGQEGRLERESKVVNLLRPLDEDGYNPRVFLVLERGSAPVYNNAFNRVRDDFGQFQESSLDLVHKDWTQDPRLLTHWRSYRSREGFDEKERRRRMSNNKNQFTTWSECMNLVERSELARGAKYDSVIKLRDNSLVLAPLNMKKLLAGRRVMTKGCSRWGGISDKVAVLPREYADAYMKKPLKFLEFVQNGVKPYSKLAERCENPEQILRTALVQIPKAFSTPNELPIVDGRPLGNGSFCLRTHHKDCHPKHTTIPTCKSV